jgi:hypothetical protein
VRSVGGAAKRVGTKAALVKTKKNAHEMNVTKNIEGIEEVRGPACIRMGLTCGRDTNLFSDVLRLVKDLYRRGGSGCCVDRMGGITIA